MSKRCEICHKKALNSVSRSHSNIATKRKQNLNLQQITKDGKKIKVCVRCLKKQTK